MANAFADPAAEAGVSIGLVEQRLAEVVFARLADPSSFLLNAIWRHSASGAAVVPKKPTGCVVALSQAWQSAKFCSSKHAPIVLPLLSQVAMPGGLLLHDVHEQLGARRRARSEDEEGTQQWLNLLRFEASMGDLT